MKNCQPLVLAIIFFVLSCTPSNSVTPTNPNLMDSLSGSLVCNRLDIVLQDTLLRSEMAYALFRNNPNDTNTIEVDSVLINETPLTFMTTSYFGAAPNEDSSTHWKVLGGSTNIPNLNYVYSYPFPNYSVSLPDTVHINSGFTFSCSFSGADSIQVSLDADSLGNALHKKSYSASTNSISYSPAELVNVQLSNANIVITVFKNNIHTVNSKHFLFGKMTIIESGHTIFMQ